MSSIGKLLSSSHNTQLATLLSNFNTSNGGASVSLYNVSSLFSAVLATPANYANPTAFTNTNAACRAGDLDTVQAGGFATANCPNADAYVFWDEVRSMAPLCGNAIEVWQGHWCMPVCIAVAADICRLRSACIRIF